MEKDSNVFCKVFEKEISIGLCSEVCAILGGMLKQVSVPELDDLDWEIIKKRCDSCSLSEA